MKNLAAELDNRGVGFVEACGGLAVLDHLDDARLDPCLERLGLVRCPFELAVHLARGCQDGDLAYARRKSRFEAQVPVERTRVLGRLRAVEPDAARALQPRDRGARRRHTVVMPLAELVQIFT